MSNYTDFLIQVQSEDSALFTVLFEELDMDFNLVSENLDLYYSFKNHFTKEQFLKLKAILEDYPFKMDGYVQLLRQREGDPKWVSIKLDVKRFGLWRSIREDVIKYKNLIDDLV